MTDEQRCQGKILVVDDEKPVSELLRKWLTDEGYKVECAHGFDAARDRLREEGFDLMTLDIMMPEVDGLQVLRWIRKHYPDVGVVMATAIGSLDSVLEAMRAGAINYLLKPFNMDLVTEEIKRGMERQRLIAENRAYRRELEQKVEERTRELRQAHARLEQQVKELEGRDRLVHFQMEAHSLEEAHTEVLEVLKQVLDVERAVIYRPDETGGRLQAVAGMGLSAPGRLEEKEQLAALPVLSIDADVPLETAVFRERSLRQDRQRTTVPILYRNEVLGVLSVECPREELTDERLNILWRLSGEAALVLQGAMMTEGLKEEILALNELENLE